MTAQCHTCGSRNLRPSLLKRKDLIYLFALRSPVRCRQCRERFYVSIFSIRKVRRDAYARRARKESQMRGPQAEVFDWQNSEDLR